MFGTFNLCASAVLLASLTAAVVINVPESPTSGAPVNITWTPDPTLPMFSVELVNTKNFHNSLAIDNSVNPALGSITLVIPDVPPSDGYSLQFCNVTDINDIYGESDEFSIAPTPPESSTTSTTVTGTLASASVASMTATMPMSGSTASMSAMHMSGVSALPSVSASASVSAASTRASSAAAPPSLQLEGASTTFVGVVLLGLLSAAWIL
ncbi:hypothetical protein K438DRAFT_2029962 [Mycena galopus ATCC 62051]|nr:hypothetical protein K438DRAFT_2029962 [Mycena galopus ATCC 62051]